MSKKRYLTKVQLRRVLRAVNRFDAAVEAKAFAGDEDPNPWKEMHNEAVNARVDLLRVIEDVARQQFLSGVTDGTSRRTPARKPGVLEKDDWRSDIDD